MKFIGTHLLILTLAGTALFFASGCTWDPFAIAVGYDPEKIADQYIIVRCDQDSQTLQAYQGDDESTTYGSGPHWGEQPIGSPINGKPCSVSNENQDRPFSVSEAVNKGIYIPPSGSARRAHATTGTTKLTDNFSEIVPLLFNPPFPQSDAGTLPAACLSTLGAYIVNHLQNTVTSFGVCPLQSSKDIPVRSNPLQLALTPDGTTLLVTSYDSAVSFIDTSTDTVTTTLDVTPYNPSGIAMSPDGTRAYVTHYLDVGPALLVIDVPNRKLLSAIPLPEQYPRVVAVTPDGAQAWVSYLYSTDITIVDTLSSTVSGSINLSALLGMGIAFNPTGTKAFIAASPGNLLVVDTGTLATLANIPVGPSPTDVIADPNGQDVFVNSGTMAGLWHIDAVNNKLISAPASLAPSNNMGLIVIR